ncbi:MAG: hypothetical protein V2I63_05650 [Pseudomonadales bacterium]|nr:hypothetical protein [Pseudomonadales bacterium]
MRRESIRFGEALANAEDPALRARLLLLRCRVLALRTQASAPRRPGPPETPTWLLRAAVARGSRQLPPAKGD